MIIVIKFKLNVGRRVLVELIALHILWNSNVQYVSQVSATCPYPKHD